MKNSPQKTVAPKVSVLLPVYNGESYLEESIKSILNQKFQDFELIIINDGSTDSSSAIVKGFNDTRIRFIEQKNVGLAQTLNNALKLAQGVYIARQDQDDISLPNRLAKQVDFLDKHASVGLLGCYSRIWVEDRPTNRFLKHALTDTQIRFDLLFDTPFVHSSIMARSALLEKVGGYSTNPLRQPPEDFELWSRLALHCQLANLPEILHLYRESRGSMSRVSKNPFLGKVMTISQGNIAHLVKKSLPNKTIEKLVLLSHDISDSKNKTSLAEVKLLLENIGRQLDPQGKNVALKNKIKAKILRIEYTNARSIFTKTAYFLLLKLNQIRHTS